MPRQPEVPTNWLHCVHLAGLGGGPQVLAQPGGEAGLLSLAADADAPVHQLLLQLGQIPIQALFSGLDPHKAIGKAVGDDPTDETGTISLASSG